MLSLYTLCVLNTVNLKSKENPWIWSINYPKVYIIWGPQIQEILDKVLKKSPWIDYKLFWLYVHIQWLVKCRSVFARCHGNAWRKSLMKTIHPIRLLLLDGCGLLKVGLRALWYMCVLLWFHRTMWRWKWKRTARSGKRWASCSWRPYSTQLFSRPSIASRTLACGRNLFCK